jgi:hypothetical protein
MAQLVFPNTVEMPLRRTISGLVSGDQSFYELVWTQLCVSMI